MRLYDSAWFTSYDLTGKNPGEVKILVRDSIPFPFLNKDESGFIICLPNLKKLRDKTVEYQGMFFDLENEFHNQVMWSLFTASIYYLSLFTVASDVEAYSGCLKEKDEETALNAVNIVEDVMITAYIKAFHRSLLPEIVLADAISYLLLRPADRIRNEGVRLASSVLSCYKTGMIKGKISERVLSDTVDIVSRLRALEEETVKSYSDAKNGSDNDESPTANDDGKRRAFSEIYGKLSEYSSSISEIPSFLHMNHLSKSSIFYTKMEVPAEDEIGEVLDEMTRRLNLRIDFNLKALRSRATQALWDWATRERKKEKVLGKYKIIGEDTHFRSFVFPEEDYAEYLRRKETHTKTIRRVTNRLAAYANISGEDFRRETGIIDLQQAIQVVASQSQRTDIFMEDALRDRGQAWAILVDVSLSLRDFAGEVKDVILCLSEVSRKLFHGNRSLGIFAFGDRFYVVKDFGEHHTRSVCARIGGIEHSGMTYLSDGMKVTSQALRKQYEESKILIVVSDGFPSGYRSAVEETKEQVENVLRSGVQAIGIGIGTGGIKDYFPIHCAVRNPHELMKSFVNTFLQYSAM